MLRLCPFKGPIQPYVALKGPHIALQQPGHWKATGHFFEGETKTHGKSYTQIWILKGGTGAGEGGLPLYPPLRSRSFYRIFQVNFPKKHPAAFQWPDNRIYVFFFFAVLRYTTQLVVFGFSAFWCAQLVCFSCLRSPCIPKHNKNIYIYIYIHV